MNTLVALTSIYIAIGLTVCIGYFVTFRATINSSVWEKITTDKVKMDLIIVIASILWPMTLFSLVKFGLENTFNNKSD